MSVTPPPPGTRTADYDYELPDARIAQHPVEPRDASRLLVMDRLTGALSHRRFSDLVDHIAPGDALVVNATRVFRARLLGIRDSGSPAEVFLQRPLDTSADPSHWEAMVQPGSKIRPGRRVTFAPGFIANILDTTPRRTRVVELVADREHFDSVADAIARCGHVPLPPYIERADAPADDERYQTVYARAHGSVAAPTAGLHFTIDLLAQLAKRGVIRAEVTLHVGAGTFRPVQDDDPDRHVMHGEWCEVSPEAAATLAAVRADGKRIWAVGTTVVRTLESSLDAHGTIQAGTRETNLFIRPPQPVRSVDALITNFHLPRSTLLMLVSSFAGYDHTMHAYREAIANEYRFYSYGDAMCIL